MRIGYYRISDDDTDEAKGVARQDAGSTVLAERLEKPITHRIFENDISASEYSDKPRPGFAELLGLIRSGTAKSIHSYSQERLTRREDEWALLAGLCRLQSVEVVIENRGGVIDIASATGRLTSGLFALLSGYESALISERVKKAKEQSRAAGEYSSGGPRPFGFTTSGRDATVVPEEADCIRLGARILLAGGTYGEVAREWTRMGVKPVSAKTWQRDSIRGIYRSGRCAGLVTYKGEVVGEARGGRILDRATWDALQQATQHAPRRPAAVRQHALVGFVFCGICGAKMVVQGDSYKCVPQRQGCGGTRRSKPWLDAVVDGYVREKLTAAQPVEALPTTGARDEVIKNLEARIAALREQFEADDSDLAPEDYFPSLTAMRTRVNELRRQEADAVRRMAAAAPSEPLAVWEDEEALTARRGILAGLISGIYVKPLGRIGRREIPISSVDILPA